MRKLSYILLFMIAVLLTSCSLENDVPPDNTPDNSSGNSYEIKNPVPGNNSIVQTRKVQLNWYAEGNPDYYTVIFDDHSNPTKILVNSANSAIIHKSRLREEQSYYWKIIATYPDGSTITSPEWSFVVDNLYPEGYTLVKHSSGTSTPSNVNLMFQVFNLDDLGITDFGTDKFDYFDDGEYIHEYESVVQINKAAVPAMSLKTVIMIDNSSSIDATELETLKNAAVEFLQYGVEPYQSTCLYTFSENITELSSFTDDYNALIGMVRSITQGQPSTNLYGAVIEGVKKWEDLFNETIARQGVLIIFTDGKDTQSSHTLNEAIAAVGGKQVILVSYDSINQIDLGILQQLATDDVYYTTEMDFLKDRMKEYRERLYYYGNSFYNLSYTSPKRGNGNHQLMIRVKDNVYEGTGSFIFTDYNSGDFK